MAAITHIYAREYAAKMMDEDLKLLEAIAWNDDNLTYGSIVTVHTGPDEAITALTDDGIKELTDMLRDARITTESWHEFLDDFVHDAELVARIGPATKTTLTRQQREQLDLFGALNLKTPN